MSQDLVELDSTETSPQGVPVRTESVGSDYDVEEAIVLDGIFAKLDGEALGGPKFKDKA